MSFLSVPVLAKDYTYRDTTEVEVPAAQDRELGVALAEMVSHQRVLQKAAKMLKNQSFAQKANLTEQEFQVLAMIQATNQLSYESKVASRNPRHVVYKTKLDYDSIKFPKDFKKYRARFIAAYLGLNRVLKMTEVFKQELLAYFDKLNRSTPEVRAVTRATEGTRLVTKYEAMKAFTKALYYTQHEKKEEATSFFDKAIKLAPDNSTYRVMGLSGILPTALKTRQDHKDLEEAINLLSDVIDDHPESDYYLTRASLYVFQGLAFDLAYKDVEKVLKKEPNNVFAHMTLGYIGARWDRMDLQRKGFGKACDLKIEQACETLEDL